MPPQGSPDRARVSIPDWPAFVNNFFYFFYIFFKVAAGQLKRASRQAFYPYTLQLNAYTLDHLHKHLFHGAKSLASMAYGILLLGSKLCRRAAVLI